MSRADRWIEFSCLGCGDLFTTQDLAIVDSGYCVGCEKKRELGLEDRMEQKTLAISPPTPQSVSDEAMWKLIAGGDLKGLTDKQKTEYYLQLCASLQMNPATSPFEYITLNGKLRLYAKKDATDQLRQIRGVSILGKPEVVDDGEYITATVAVEDKFGRSDSDIGVVFAGNNKGEIRANLRMKALTKAKRRATLSVCGLGMLDESEVEDIPQSRVSRVTLPVTVEPEDETQETPNTEADMEEAMPPPASEVSAKVLAAYKEFGVGKKELEDFLERDYEDWRSEDHDALRRIFKEIKNGATTWKQVCAVKSELAKTHALA